MKVERECQRLLLKCTGFINKLTYAVKGIKLTISYNKGKSILYRNKREFSVWASFEALQRFMFNPLLPPSEHNGNYILYMTG